MKGSSTFSKSKRLTVNDTIIYNFRRGFKRKRRVFGKNVVSEPDLHIQKSFLKELIHNWGEKPHPTWELKEIGLAAAIVEVSCIVTAIMIWVI